MRPRPVWNLPCLLLIHTALALAVSSCAVPLPSPRESHATAKLQSTTSLPASTASVTASPTTVSTNTPVILVLPTHTPRPSVTVSTSTGTAKPLKPALTPTARPTATAVAPTPSATLTRPTPSKTAAKPSPAAMALPSEQSTSPSPVISAVQTATPPLKSKATAVAVPTHALPSPTRTASTTATVSPTSRATVTAVATSAATPVATLGPQRASVVPSPTPEPTIGEILLNGNFEGGFDERGIAKHWQGFDKVSGVYGWSDETWHGLLSDGQHAQMMRIKFTTEPDQYIGIQQTFSVIPGQPYDLTIHGVIRSAEGSAQASNWGYRLQWGIDPQGRDSWEVVRNWYDSGWDDQPLDAQQYTIDDCSATITPPEDTITLFIRGWRKWGIRDREVDFVIDGISLTGPIPYPEAPASLPVTGATDYTWPLTAIAGLILVVIIFALRKVRNLYATNR